jgi:hypothetical protein
MGERTAPRTMLLGRRNLNENSPQRQLADPKRNRLRLSHTTFIVAGQEYRVEAGKKIMRNKISDERRRENVWGKSFFWREDRWELEINLCAPQHHRGPENERERERTARGENETKFLINKHRFSPLT